MKSRFISMSFLCVFLMMLFCMVFTKAGFCTVVNTEVLYKGTLGSPSNTVNFSAVAVHSNNKFVIAGVADNAIGAGDFIDFSPWGSNDGYTAVFDYDSLGNKFDIGMINIFGTQETDAFADVKTLPDGGTVSVGHSYNSNNLFGTGDFSGVSVSGFCYATIVKRDANGNIVFKKYFGGSTRPVGPSGTSFSHVEESTAGNFIVSGSGYNEELFNTGDLVGMIGKGDRDGIVVKYNASSNVVWKKNFGGSAYDNFYGGCATPDGGYVAVGESTRGSFGNGDWVGYTARCTGAYDYDAIIIRYDTNGNVAWKKNFGGAGYQQFNAVTATSDGGFIAVGYTSNSSFGTGDWSDVSAGNGNSTIVKFDSAGNVVWKKRASYGTLTDIKPTADGGFVVCSSGYVASLAGWEGGSTRGGSDGILVKLDSNGNSKWMVNFGGAGNDGFKSVAVMPNGNIVAAGYSYAASFGNGDWVGFNAKGNLDVIYAIFRDVVIHKVEFMKYPNNNDVVTYEEDVIDGNKVVEADIETPDRIGFIFEGWFATNTNGTDKGLTTPFDFNTPITQDTRVWAKWTPIPDTITLNWYDGETNRTRNIRTFSTLIEDLTAQPTSGGNQFKYWTITTPTKDAEIFSYDRVITFIITESMTLTAVYGSTVSERELILLIDDESMEEDYGVPGRVDISFFGDMVIPDTVTLVEKGFIGSYYKAGDANYDRNESNFIIGANKVTKIPVPGPTRKSQATFKNVVDTWQYASRAYITYIDTDSVTKTVYSNIVIRTPQP